MCLYPLNTKLSADLQTPKNLATLLMDEGKRGMGEFVLGIGLRSVCGTGSFSAHTATHSINESAHETQSFSPKSRNPNKPKTPS